MVNELTPAMMKRKEEIKSWLMMYEHPNQMQLNWFELESDKACAAMVWETLIEQFHIKPNIAMYLMIRSVFWDMLVLDPLFVGHYDGEHWAFSVLYSHGIAKSIPREHIPDIDAFHESPFCSTQGGLYLRVEMELLKAIQKKHL